MRPFTTSSRLQEGYLARLRRTSWRAALIPQTPVSQSRSSNSVPCALSGRGSASMTYRSLATSICWRSRPCCWEWMCWGNLVVCLSTIESRWSSFALARETTRLIGDVNGPRRNRGNAVDVRVTCTRSCTCRENRSVTSEEISNEIKRRRTFAIISHPDAGKTTLTEKLLLFGGAIQMAGAVKGRKAARHATSDWMRLEQQRGISVTSSVMQFPFDDCIVNLLDTPGHEDFSEDTYRTLTAVDSALMVIDCAKGVEERTIKLMDVCRLRDTPIMTFVNKLDRDGRQPIELLDEIESVLKIQCAPITWPIGMGRDLLGVYHLIEDVIYVYVPVEKGRVGTHETIVGIESDAAREFLGERYEEFLEEADLVRGASPQFDVQRYLAARQTPVFFGSAVNNFGVRELLSAFVAHSPGPQPRPALQRTVEAQEPKLTGFVFKIQANMDPGHRDRIAFMRLCS